MNGQRRNLDVRPPADRGPLLSSAQVAQLIGGVSPEWVRRTVPHKVTLGQRTVRWYEYDVKAWLESRRGSDGQAA